MAFYFVGTFFPRLTLLVYYMLDLIPSNDVPLVLDLIMAIFLPRLLLAYYGYLHDIHPLWIALFVLLQVFESYRGVQQRQQQRAQQAARRWETY